MNSHDKKIGTLSSEVVNDGMSREVSNEFRKIGRTEQGDYHSGPGGHDVSFSRAASPNEVMVRSVSAQPAEEP